MNLVDIKDYEGLYSFDLNTNQVFGHKKKHYLKSALGGTGYYLICMYKTNNRKTIQLHRLVYQAHNGIIPQNMVIDHIDRNKLNNNIENLRLSTRSQNQYNRTMTKNNKSGIKNIILTKNNTYRLQIMKDNKIMCNKTFKTLEEAIEYKKIKLQELHGEFANID